MSEVFGFIGLGNMGSPMARRLVAAGHKLIVHDPNAAATAVLAGLGAEVAASPAAVAERAHTVFASLPMPAIVEKVALGANGLIEGKAIRRFVDLSTTGATTSARIAAALGERGIVHLDSPVSGGVAGAEKGTLAVMVSGPRADFDALRPALDQIGKVFFIGEAAGLAQTMKLANNLLSATALAATAEAVVMGVKAGIDPGVMIDVINAGSGRNSASQDKFPRSILPRTFDFGFSTALMYKDLKLCMEEAEASGVQMWVGNSVKQLWQLVNSQIGPDSDFTQVIEVPERWAGVEVRAAKPSS